MNTLKKSALALTALGLAACGYIPENPPPACEGQTCTVEEGDVLVTVVDATHEENFVALDLDKGGALAEGASTWDLRFRRSVVWSNGGETGEGGVEVAVLDDVAFDEVTRAPADGYLVDSAELDRRDNPETAFQQEGAWYDYNLLTHVLSATPDRVYVVKTTDEAFFKLAFRDYYDAEGTAGHVSFQWAAVAAP